MDLPPLFGIHVWWARRPLVASAGAVLASLMPSWTEELAVAHPDWEELCTEKAYQSWFLRLCGILGNAVTEQALYDAARASGKRIKNPYSHKQAYKNSPTKRDLAILHTILEDTWGFLPSVIDPTAGGGSIPYEAVRYGLPTIANDLNSISTAIMRAAVEMPATYGLDLVPDLRHWGDRLVRQIQQELSEYFPSGRDEEVATFLFSRVVSCPRTGKPVPLSPNWWLCRDPGDRWAVRLLTHRKQQLLESPAFEIVGDDEIDFDPDKGTSTGGAAVSPWDGLLIDGDYIKGEARAGRMGSVLYAVAVQKNGRRVFRAPTARDLDALSAAEEALANRLKRWEVEDVLPSEAVPPGNDQRPHQYGMSRWRDMFSPRQLLVHGTFVEQYRRLLVEARSEIGHDRAAAVFSLLSLMIGKGTNWNAQLSSWDVSRQKIRSVFDTHGFAFKPTFAEFEGSRELYRWCFDRGIMRAYASLSNLLAPAAVGLSGLAPVHSVPGSVAVLQGTAGDLESVPDKSQTLVCIDPPYYDNVMYAELADFFYVWEKRTLGTIYPEFFRDDLCDKKNEAVANPARFAEAGKRRKALATADYEAKMTAIFAECHRVLRDDGVLTVMFTHKRAEAWDTLGMSLMQAGFAIESSWPVATESEQSLHQAGQNSVSSTIFLVGRKRPEHSSSAVFFEDVEGEVRAAARDALAKFSAFGIDGVDLLLSTYGPALSVISSQWPVYSSEADPLTGKSRLLRPEEALDAARGELVRLQRQRLIGRAAQLDPITDFVLLAWEIFKAREFPFDEARRLALAVGGLDVDELVRAKVIDKKSGTVVLTPPSKRVRRQADLEVGLPGIYLDAQSFPVIIDALHTAMHLAAEDGPTAAKAWLDRVGLTGDQRFQAALQGLVNAMPRTKTKDKWAVPEAEWLDAVCFYFSDVTVPKARTAEEPAEQAQLDFGV
jgi:adenine-specific DNA methylase